MHATRATVFACLLIVLLLPVVPVYAQIEAFAATHPFALPGSTTARLFGMGGFVSCVQDEGFANPAFAGLLTHPAAVARVSMTDYDGGLELTGRQISAAVPLTPGRRGLQVTAFQLDAAAGAGPAAVPGAPQYDVSEYEIAVHYGQKLTDRLAVGISVSPTFHSNVQVRQALPDPNVLTTRSSSSQGFRLGAVYQLTPQTTVGGVYDRYDESVLASGLALGGMTLDEDATSEEKIFGVSHRFNNRWLAAVEWQEISTDIMGGSFGDSGWRCGVECQLNDNWAVRAGDNDGSFSAGLGYQQGRWAARYAYIQDWNNDIVGAQWGGSDTHQFEAVCTW